jgi:DNA repair ATPase RecN
MNLRQTLSAGLVLTLPFLFAACGSKTDPAAAAQLEQELQQLRSTNQELQRLRAENQELPRLRKDNEEVTRLQAQIKDLAQLREENGKLRGELQALKGPKAKP